MWSHAHHVRKGYGRTEGACMSRASTYSSILHNHIICVLKWSRVTPLSIMLIHLLIFISLHIHLTFLLSIHFILLLSSIRVSEGGCGTEFCWLCLDRWSTHGEGSGTYMIIAEQFRLYKCYLRSIESWVIIAVVRTLV